MGCSVHLQYRPVQHPVTSYTWAANTNHFKRNVLAGLEIYEKQLSIRSTTSHWTVRVRITSTNTIRVGHTAVIRVAGNCLGKTFGKNLTFIDLKKPLLWYTFPHGPVTISRVFIAQSFVQKHVHVKPGRGGGVNTIENDFRIFTHYDRFGCDVLISNYPGRYSTLKRMKER